MRSSVLPTAAHLKGVYDRICEEMEENPEAFVKHPGKDFTRRRKLSMRDVLSFITGIQGGSLKKELYDKYASNLMTVSAFVQQRDKLKPEAFLYLFNQLNEMTSSFDIVKYRGYRLYAIDGSHLNVFRNPQADSFLPKYGEKGINQLHFNAMYDICNKTFLDCIIQPESLENEYAAAKEMVGRHKYKDRSIVLFDRGYPGFSLFETINRIQNLDYLARAMNSFSILKNYPLEEFDVDLSIPLRTTQTNEDKEAYKSGKAVYVIGPSKFGKPKKDVQWEFGSPFTLKLRVVRFQLETGEWETLVTSLNRFEFSIQDLKELYHLRWGIETAFRDLKYAIGLNNFHAKREDFVIQEIYAKLFMFNFSQRIIVDVVATKSQGKYAVYQINYTYAIHVCRDLFRKGTAPPGFNRNIRLYVEPVRPGRHDERKLYPKGFVPFIYRVA